MNLNALPQLLRDTSDRFGGIKHYLEAAGELDRAITLFFKEQDMDSLLALNGAVARCSKYRREVDVAGDDLEAVE